MRRSILLTALALIPLLLCGCGRPRDLWEPTPLVDREVDRYGPQEAIARALDNAERRRTAQAYTRLAQTYAVAQEPKEARRALAEAVKISPGYPPSGVTLAHVLLTDGKAQEAERAARAVLAAQPAQPDATQVLARALMAQGKPQAAESALSEVLKAHADQPGLHRALADCYASQGRFGEALPEYERALKATPRSAGVMLPYADALADAGQKERAAEVALEAVRLAPDSSEARFVAGVHLAQVGREPEAIQQYKQALLIAPNLFTAANNLALLLADRNQDTSAAVSWARKAVRLSPGIGTCVDTLGWALARDGQLEDAERILRQVYKNWPDSPAVWYHLGWTLAKSGRTAEGLALLKRASESDREDLAPKATRALRELS